MVEAVAGCQKLDRNPLGAEGEQGGLGEGVGRVLAGQGDGGMQRSRRVPRRAHQHKEGAADGGGDEARRSQRGQEQQVRHKQAGEQVEGRTGGSSKCGRRHLGCGSSGRMVALFTCKTGFSIRTWGAQRWAGNGR